MRLLVVEDEKHLRLLTAKRLAEEGYSVDACADGREALDHISLAEYDAVILDIMLPKLDGLSVLRTMRQLKNQTPVLLLTARDSVADKVAGLNSGADDYLVKPFAFDELLARVRVLIRRQATDAVQNEFALADLVVNLNARSVTRAGKVITLTQKEFSVLEYLMHNKGVVMTRNRIEQHIWNSDYDGASNVIDVYIRCLRKKIDDGHEDKLIHTVRGVGYVMRSQQ